MFFQEISSKDIDFSKGFFSVELNFHHALIYIHVYSAWWKIQRKAQHSVFLSAQN